MDDIEELRRKRAIKVIIADLIMAFSVIAIVSILVMAVAGWRINKDFQVEQNGLVSIKTKPTGATIFVDDEKEFQASNASKMLPGGNHKIALERDGYERWEKEIWITPGWLYRLEYPRLFKQDRDKTIIKDFENLNFFHVSPDNTTAIYSEDNTTAWYVISNFNGTPKFRNLNINGIFSGTKNGTFNYEIKSLEWSKNSEKILLNVVGEYVNDENKTIKVNEWGIINVKNVDDSINLSVNLQSFDIKTDKNTVKNTNKNNTIARARFENEAGDKVIATTDNNLIRIDVAAKNISEPFDKNVDDFSLYDSTVIYSTLYQDGKKHLKMIKLSEKNPSVIATSVEKVSYKFALTKFNSMDYVLYTVNNHLYVYRDRDFQFGGNDHLNMKKITDAEIGVTPTEVIRSANDEFIVLREGTKILVFDAELELLHEYDNGNETVRFLDKHLLYRVDKTSGTFLTWDFDGTNVRTLVVDRAIDGYDALISPNDRYFYYLAKTTSGILLIQEKLD